MSCSFVNLAKILVDSILLGLSFSFKFLTETISTLGSWFGAPLAIELGMVFTIYSIFAGFS